MKSRWNWFLKSANILSAPPIVAAADTIKAIVIHRKWMSIGILRRTVNWIPWGLSLSKLTCKFNYFYIIRFWVYFNEYPNIPDISRCLYKETNLYKILCKAYWRQSPLLILVLILECQLIDRYGLFMENLGYTQLMITQEHWN